MHSIFISYSSKHRELTRELAAAIEAQYGEGSVWWDHALESRASYSDQIKAALEEQRVGSAAEKQALHIAEQWRDSLIAQEEALGAWMAQFPDTDTQQLRALIRQARKDAPPLDAKALSQGLAPRRGRAYRELFQFVKEHLNPGSTANTGDDEADDDHL